MITVEELAIARINTLNYWGRYTISDLQKSIRIKNIGRSHNLINSLKYNVHPESNGNAKIIFEFIYYGRLLDMGVGRGRKIEDIKSNRAVYNAISQKNKNHKWLSKVAYTNIAALKNIMQEKYGEDVQNLIREGISTNINISL